jgi:hypothetical protein
MSLKERWAKLKERWRAVREASHKLRPLDTDDKEALAFLIDCAGEVLRDGSISVQEAELLREAWAGWREARSNTP